MRKDRALFLAAVAAVLIVGILALAAPPAAAGPQPGCNRRCRPFVMAGGMKCYFVGCDVDGICRYIC